MKACRITQFLSCLILLSIPSLASAENNRLSKVLQILESAPTGKVLLQYARSKEIINRIYSGAVSKTDAVITRRFDIKSQQEFRERKVEIHLNLNQPEVEATLDLAHELTHALAPMSVDPYDAKLKVEDYIRNGIEGVGGEADALATECTVSGELKSQGVIMNDARCARYQKALSSSQTEARNIILKDFYRVGYWLPPLRGVIATIKFPHLSGREPILYSSTGRKPYPMALYEEFRQISKLACENTQRRVALLPSRSPASENESAQALHGFLLARCSQRE